jgi:hypothetical protein
MRERFQSCGDFISKIIICSSIQKFGEFGLDFDLLEDLNSILPAWLVFPCEIDKTPHGAQD